MVKVEVHRKNPTRRRRRRMGRGRGSKQLMASARLEEISLENHDFQFLCCSGK